MIKAHKGTLQKAKELCRRRFDGTLSVRQRSLQETLQKNSADADQMAPGLLVTKSSPSSGGPEKKCQYKHATEVSEQALKIDKTRRWHCCREHGRLREGRKKKKSSERKHRLLCHAISYIILYSTTMAIRSYGKPWCVTGVTPEEKQRRKQLPKRLQFH